jgi:3-hydroxyacyl-CoA dehydrogenase
LYGYGFPVYRGGPMWYADNEIGLPQVLEKLEKFNAAYPGSDYYKPSELLKKLVAEKKKLYEHYP